MYILEIYHYIGIYGLSICDFLTQSPLVYNDIIEFSLNVFTEFTEFSDKNTCHYSKRA